MIIGDVRDTSETLWTEGLTLPIVVMLTDGIKLHFTAMNQQTWILIMFWSSKLC